MSAMDLLVVGVAALVVTSAAVPLVRRVMLGRGVLDVPNHRSSHSTPVPRGGGIACAAGVVGACLVAASIGVTVPTAAVIAAAALAVVGLLDDKLHLPAVPRLGAQVAVGAVFGAVIGGGTLWGVVGAVLMPLVVNVVNFMDGINGVTALTLFTWGCTTALAGLLYDAGSLGVLGIVTAGAALGFLPFNAPRARIFLGDVGSYLFGALAATGLMLGTRAEASPALVVAPLIIYGVDVIITLARRAICRAPLLEAHREHIYQRLVVHHGIPHIAVALAVTFFSLAIVLAWNVDHLAFAIAVTAIATLTYTCAPRMLAMAAIQSKRQSMHFPCTRLTARWHRSNFTEDRP